MMENTLYTASMVATNHMWLLSTWHMADMIEEQDVYLIQFKF